MMLGEWDTLIRRLEKRWERRRRRSEDENQTKNCRHYHHPLHRRIRLFQTIEKLIACSTLSSLCLLSATCITHTRALNAINVFNEEWQWGSSTFFFAASRTMFTLIRASYSSSGLSCISLAYSISRLERITPSRARAECECISHQINLRCVDKTWTKFTVEFYSSRRRASRSAQKFPKVCYRWSCEWVKELLTSIDNKLQNLIH